MSKGLFQKFAETFAGAAPDTTLAALQGNLKIVFAGTKGACQSHANELRSQGVSASVVASKETGEYMVTTTGLQL